MSEISLFVTSTCNFNIVVHMEACTCATLTVLTQEQTVCAGVKVEVVFGLQGRLAYNVAALTQDTYCVSLRGSGGRSCLPNVTPSAPCRHAMKVSRSRLSCLRSTSLFAQRISSLKTT